MIQAHHGSLAEHFLSGHGRAAEPARRSDAEGPRRRQPEFFYRRRRHQQTLNTGRFLINLKPHDERSLNASADHPPHSAARSSGIVGITLYMQPVQDLTIDSTVSRAQYNFVLEDANPAEFNTWVPRLVAAPQPAAAAHRRRQRSAAAGPGAGHRHRPRNCRPVRHHAGDRRQRALRRVRPAHHFDDLYPIEPVSRHPRGGSDAAMHRSTGCR